MTTNSGNDALGSWSKMEDRRSAVCPPFPPQTAHSKIVEILVETWIFFGKRIFFFENPKINPGNFVPYESLRYLDEMSPRVGEIFRAPSDYVMHHLSKNDRFLRFLGGKCIICNTPPPDSMLKSVWLLNMSLRLTQPSYDMLVTYSESVKFSTYRKNSRIHPTLNRGEGVWK